MHSLTAWSPSLNIHLEPWPQEFTPKLGPSSTTKGCDLVLQCPLRLRFNPRTTFNPVYLRALGPRNSLQNWAPLPPQRVVTWLLIPSVCRYVRLPLIFLPSFKSILNLGPSNSLQNWAPLPPLTGCDLVFFVMPSGVEGSKVNL